MSNRAARTILATASPVLLGSGAAAWAAITKQLKDQKITVHPDSARLGGRPVAGPMTAFEQANVVGQHAEHIGGGRTFAELSDEYMGALAAGDTARAEELAGPRETVMQGNFVRASLFTSVLAYGVSALVVGLGVLSGATAAALDD
ncbi:aromatic ring-opening dioxygenase LigA [Luteococcus peritonei]|uniref:Aromatic ring-opening dioxygenase LigA n=1 Tax=Luteococcus peritonei TaxID=88874 RepID=A0ABW4RZU4_9ACTN